VLETGGRWPRMPPASVFLLLQAGTRGQQIMVLRYVAAWLYVLRSLLAPVEPGPPGSHPAAAARFCPAEQVMEYAVSHYDVAYVLKTDDDAFINVAPMVEQLKLLCQNPGCQK